MVNAAGEARAPLGAPMSSEGSVPDPGSMAAVFANFRQYLMGWDTAQSSVSDLDLFRSGLLTPQFNGVVRLRSVSAAGQAVAAARGALTGLPWWWWVGPDSPEATADELRRHGGDQLAVLPVMVRSLDGPSAPGDGLAPVCIDDVPGLRVEEVGDGDRLAELVRTYRTSMGIALPLEAELVRLESRREDHTDIVRLAAVLDGRVVGTTVVIAAHGVAGIFLVHVAEEHRRRGIGAALTAAALRCGRLRSMRTAALVASPAGEPLYRRLGFTTSCEYRLFTFPA
ncbi:GNAT family N-acetyltransferase [Streptomyces bobili]